MGDSPSARYQAGVARGDWQDDPAQRAVLVELDRLHAALAAPAPGPGLLGRLFGRGDHAPAPRGLYLWGGVGRGMRPASGAGAGASTPRPQLARGRGLSRRVEPPTSPA